MKLNKYFSTLLGGLLLFGTWACTDKIEPEPTPAYEGNDVYFSTTASEEVDIPNGATEVSVEIYRVKAGDAQTVNLSASFSMEDEEGNEVPCTGIFTAPATVTFEVGEKKATVPVAVDFSKVEAGVEYYMTLKIDGNITSVYGDAEKTFTMAYSQWSDWTWYETPATLCAWSINGPLAEAGEAGTLSPADLEDSMDEDGDYYLLYYDGQIITRKSLINENLWMIGVGGPRYSNFHFNLIFTIDDAKFVEVEGKQYPYVSMQTIEDCGYEYKGEVMSIMDCRTFMTDYLGQKPGSEKYEQIWEGNDLKDNYYDPNTGVIHYFPMYVTESSPFLPTESFIFLPGFADYSLEFSYDGNFVDKKGVENAVVTITRSDDVHSYVYGVEAGALTDTQVEEVGQSLAANTELDLIYDMTKQVMIPCSEDGTYTIVAVLYDQKGTVVGYDSFAFNFESVMKETMWTKVGLAYFNDDIMTSFFESYSGDTFEVECEQHKEYPGIFRLVDPLIDWTENKDIVSTGTPGYIIFDTTDPEAVYIMDSPLGFSVPVMTKTDEEFYLIDQANGMDSEQMIEWGCNGTNVDGVITFPATFISPNNGKEYYTMLLSTESLWAEGMGLPTNENGALEIYLPDSVVGDFVKHKTRDQHKNDIRNAKVKTSTRAARGFLSPAKRKAQKAEKEAAQLKEFNQQRKVSKF